MLAGQRHKTSKGRRRRRSGHSQVFDLLSIACTASYSFALPVKRRGSLGILPQDAAEVQSSSSSSAPRSFEKAEYEDVDDFLLSGVGNADGSVQGLEHQRDIGSHSRSNQDGDSSGGTESIEERQRQWESLHAKWEEGWESTPVDRDSRGAILDGRERAIHHPFSHQQKSRTKIVPKVQKMTPEASDQLRWTRQRAPFHTSQVGKLASRLPHSIGIFQPGYPFTPSGQQRRSNGLNGTKSSQQSESNHATRLPFSSGYTLSPSVSHTNILKHGWTMSILDDDVKLSVPDERRQSRDSSLDLKFMMGKKWYRWKTGEGYVWSKKKDLSAYKHGPGIALGQLLPPRERPRLATLPWIPNDSKRDFVWLIILSLIFFTMIACIQEYRGHLKSSRKGKRRNRSSLDSLPDLSSSRTRKSLISNATPTKTRQRMRAQNFRDLCKVALLKGFNGMGMSVTSGTSGGTNIRWSSLAVNSNINDEDSGGGGGISSSYITSHAVKRSASHQSDEREGDEGSTIEMLEKGGIDGSHIVSPVLDRSGSFLTSVSTTVFDDSRYCEWNTLDRGGGGGGGKASQQGSERSSSSTTSASSNDSSNNTNNINNNNDDNNNNIDNINNTNNNTKNQ